MPEAAELVQPMFDALNARDHETLEELCDERVEVVVLPSEAGARENPYVGHSGLRDLLADAAAWEDLVLTPGETQLRGDTALVRGRVHTRSRELGLRDLPVAWVLRASDGRLASVRVFTELDDAITEAGAEGATYGV